MQFTVYLPMEPYKLHTYIVSVQFAVFQLYMKVFWYEVHVLTHPCYTVNHQTGLHSFLAEALHYAQLVPVKVT